MSGVEVGLIGLACLIGTILLHVPIGVSMMLVGATGYLILTGNLSATLSLLGNEAVGMLTNRDFAVVIAFLLMGGFAGRAGLSDDIYRLANALIGHWRGGLAMATVAGCGGFGAISGSSIATAATMVKIALPEMEKRRYSKSLAAGTLAAGGTLGSLIPPSIVMVVYAVQAEQFVVDLFMAALIPGVLTITLFMIAINLTVRLRPDAAPVSPRAGWSERLAATQKSWGAVVIIIAVLGGIYSGVFTVNEGAAVGLVLTLAFALIRGRRAKESFWQTLLDAAGNVALLYGIMIGANVFSYFITLSHMPSDVVAWVTGLGIPPLSVIFVLVAFYIVLGAVFDALAGMVLTLPFVFPVVVGLGYDPVWWGIVNVIVIEVGMITPPIGINVFVLKGMRGDIPLTAIYRGIGPFLVAHLIALFSVILFPDLALWLPSLLR